MSRGRTATRIFRALAAAAAIGASVAVIAAGPARSSADSALPPVELVQSIRQARILQSRGLHTEALDLLRKTAEAHPHALTPVLALWRYHNELGLTGEETRKLREALTGRLGDPEAPLPPGVLTYLADRPDAAPEETELPGPSWPLR